ncbi:MAG: transposase [Nitrospira sp.]
MPVLGPLGARVGVRTCDEARRFDEQQAVANEGALAPTSDQRGAVRQRGPINRDGRSEGRRVVWHGAPAEVRLKRQGVNPLPPCSTRIARRRGKTMAVVAVARQLVTTASGVQKAGHPDDPRQVQPGSGVLWTRQSDQGGTP